jgi:hypothetical protein
MNVAPRFFASLLLCASFGCSSNGISLSEESEDATSGSDGRGQAPDRDAAEERPDTATDTETPLEPDAGVVDVAPDEPTIVSVVFEPLDAVLQTTIGASAQLALTAWGTWSDGSVTELEPPLTYRSSNPELAPVSSGGIVSTGGDATGRVTIELEVEGRIASGSVLVQIVDEVLMEGALPEDPMAFDSATTGDAATAPVWEYPENGTMFPRGIVPPVLQWASAGQSAYRVRVTRSDEVVLDLYTRTNELALPDEVWSIMASGDRVPVVMELSGLSADGTTSALADPRVIQTADAELSGDVYYWQIETGDIMRIPSGARSPTAVFSDNSTNGNCRGCHTMSRDGGTLGFMYNGGDNPRAGLARVDDPENPIIANGSTFQWTMLAFDPTATRAAAVYNNAMWLADVTPGTPGGVANLGAMPTGAGATMPNWSPDGTTLAFVRRYDGSDWSNSHGDLCTIPWDSVTQTFGEPRTIVEGASMPGAQAVGWPSWSPDSRWIAINRGPSTNAASPSNLYLVDPASGTPTQIARANPAGMDAVPSFSPYRQGGFYWLLFYSTRAYGHTSTHKQLWVTAIDETMEPGSDGSYPAFWLPGQDPTRQNITGYWSPPICANEGNICKSPEECCSGQECLFSESEGTTVCVSTDCTRDGLPCAGDDDCCGGSVCLEGLAGVDVCQRRF